MPNVKRSDFYDQIDLNVDFPRLEKELLEKWDKSGLVGKYLTKNSESNNYFSFLDGPITANNPMGVHHAWGRTYKDLWQRFKNMQGFRQRFQNGFDCQGLWVEVEVEKELGFGSKKDIEGYGIAKFVEKCKERVFKYANIQTEQSKRLGYFMDWDNSYFTLSDENNYAIWHFLKKCHDHGWLYKGNDSVPWCPRCETAISQHEMLTEDYKDVVHDSVYFALPLKSTKDEHLLVWTTTPWTIPANIAVAVDAKKDYVLVEEGSKKYWVSKMSVDRVFGENAKIVKTISGMDLVGQSYTAPFDDLTKVKTLLAENELMHTTVATDDRIMPITDTEGTGLVHTAVSAGSEDFKLGKKIGLPMLPIIDDRANYLADLDYLAGKNAKKHPEVVLDVMTERRFVYKVEKYKHRYPGCWRCKTELVWKVTDEWYIAMDKLSKLDDNEDTLRKRMIKVTKNIKWLPGFGLKRELDWLNNMHDWLISKKNRFWGLCLPIWECTDCKTIEVFGSKADLKERAVEGWSEFEGKPPHKPYIDSVKIKCKECGKITERIEPVGNPWLDAGIVSFSTITNDNKGEPLYNTDKSQWKKWFPADFITESFPGQFKNWFYSLIAMSTVLENTNPFKTVLGFATLLAEDGRAMHKSWGNSIEFNEGADKIGADVMRFMFAKQQPTENMLFGYKLADEVRRQFYLKIWNIYNFFVTHANTYAFTASKKKQVSANVLDKWVLAKLTGLINEVTLSLEGFNAFRAAGLIENFVDDLSNWYVRRSRERTSLGSSKDRENYFQTSFVVLTTFSKLIAPIMPFISEVIYTNLTKEDSVHLADWPKGMKLSVADEDLIGEMQRLRAFVEKVHAKRKEDNLAVKRPLLALKVTSNEKPFAADLLAVAKHELNIKEIAWQKGKQFNLVFDLTMTMDLEEELKTRELIRLIQNERKVMNLSLTKNINVENTWIPTNKNLLKDLLTKTQTTKITLGSSFKVHEV